MCSAWSRPRARAASISDHVLRTSARARGLAARAASAAMHVPAAARARTPGRMRRHDRQNASERAPAPFGVLHGRIGLRHRADQLHARPVLHALVFIQGHGTFSVVARPSDDSSRLPAGRHDFSGLVDAPIDVCTGRPFSHLAHLFVPRRNRQDSHTDSLARPLKLTEPKQCPPCPPGILWAPSIGGTPVEECGLTCVGSVLAGPSIVLVKRMERL